MVGLADEGGWAELAALPKDRLAVLPDDVSFEAASTLPVAGLTALRALEVGGPLLGRRVLSPARPAASAATRSSSPTAPART